MIPIWSAYITVRDFKDKWGGGITVRMDRCGSSEPKCYTIGTHRKSVSPDRMSSNAPFSLLHPQSLVSHAHPAPASASAPQQYQTNKQMNKRVLSFNGPAWHWSTRAPRQPTYSQLSMNKQPLFCNPQQSPNQFVQMSNFRMMKLNFTAMNKYALRLTIVSRGCGGCVCVVDRRKRKTLINLYSTRILVSLWPFVNIIFHRNECQFFLWPFSFIASPSPPACLSMSSKIINESISRWLREPTSWH